MWAFLARIMRVINMINTFIGQVFSWLAVFVVLVCFTVVVQRYVASTTLMWMQELYVWSSGAMFMAVSGYALLRNQHVRVDIFYRPASNRIKAMADLFGTVVFIWPFLAIVAIYSLPFVQRSWGLKEISPNVDGMPGLFILKTFVLVFVAVVGLQSISMVIRSVLVLAKHEELIDPSYRYEAASE